MLRSEPPTVNEPVPAVTNHTGVPYHANHVRSITKILENNSVVAILHNS